MSRTVCAINRDVIPASFKGVPFYCVEAGAEGGRRGAEGEFPFGEHTAYADLGRKIRVYRLTAKFREDNHIGDSRALFIACETPGPGILVHPTHGVVMAACRSIKLTDNLEEQAGETSAELEFVEANIGFTGIAGSLFGIISTGLYVASQTVFLANYNATRVPQPWRIQVVDTTQRLVSNTVHVVQLAVTANNDLATWRTIASMQAVASDDSLASQALIVDRALTDGFNLISNTITNSETRFRTFRNLANSVTSTVPTLPPGVAIDSEEAVISRFRQLSAVGMAEASMGVRYNSMNDSINAMEITSIILEEEKKIAFDNCSNDLYLELKKYIIEYNKMMYDLSFRLPGTVMVNFHGGVHPLTASYAFYNDAKRHRELELRNMVDANSRFDGLVSGLSQ